MGMKQFKCVCGWSFVIGKHEVYGPIFEDGSTAQARTMPFGEFECEYGDCYFRWTRK